MVYSLLGCQSLVLIHLHQTSNQTLSCQRKIPQKKLNKKKLFFLDMNITMKCLNTTEVMTLSNLGFIPKMLSLCYCTLLTLTLKKYLNQRCHPSMESQTHNRLPGSFGKGSCHGFHNHRHPFHHRKVGCLTTWGIKGTKSTKSQNTSTYHILIKSIM